MDFLASLDLSSLGIGVGVGLIGGSLLRGGRRIFWLVYSLIRKIIKYI